MEIKPNIYGDYKEGKNEFILEKSIELILKR